MNLPGEVTWRVPSLAVPADDSPVGDRGAVGLRGGAAVRRAGRPGPVRFRCLPTPTPRRWPRSAGGWTASRWPSSWPRPGSGCSPRPRSPTGSIERFRLLTGAPRTALPRQQTLEASVDWSHHLLTDAGADGVPPPGGLRRRLRLSTPPSTVCAARPPSNPTRCSTCSRCWSTSPWSRSTTAAPGPLPAAGDRPGLRRGPSGAAPAKKPRPATVTGTTTWPSPRRPKPTWRAPAKPNGSPGSPRDYPNLRAALAWSRDQRRRRSAGPHRRRVGRVLVLPRTQHGRGSVARRRPRTILTRSTRASGQGAVGTVPSGLRTSTRPLSTSDLARGIDLAQTVDDPGLLSRLLAARGFSAILSGQPDQNLDEAVALARQAGDRFGLALALLSSWHRPPHAEPGAGPTLLEESAQIAEAVRKPRRCQHGDHQPCLRPVVARRTPRNGPPLHAGRRPWPQRPMIASTWAAPLWYRTQAHVELDERADALADAERLGVALGSPGCACGIPTSPSSAARYPWSKAP